ncbi:MAG: hypothetical protein ABI193_07870 [Minicystis sp.]
MRLLLGCWLLEACLLVVFPRPAKAVDVTGGASLGGLLAGNFPRLAVTPHVGVAWRWEGGFLIEVHDLCSILPVGSALGVGVYNQTSGALGYASEKATFGLGPSVSIYAMHACGPALCGRAIGLAPGGQADVSYFFAGVLGVSIHASVAWLGGKSLVLPRGVSAMVVAGPVLRWRSE